MKRFICLFIVMLAAVAAVFSQDSIPLPDPMGPASTVNDFLNLYNGIYGAVVILLGYLHNWIPGFKYIKTKWLRIILIAAVTGVIFVALGWTNGISTAFVFFQAVGLYEIIFKKVVPSQPVTSPKK